MFKFVHIVFGSMNVNIFVVFVFLFVLFNALKEPPALIGGAL